MDERRKFIRYDCSFKVNYASQGTVSLECHSMAENISRGGMRLPVSRLLKNGSELSLAIYARNDKSPIPARGTIVWMNKDISVSRFNAEAGIEFTDVNQDDVDKLLLMSQ